MADCTESAPEVRADDAARADIGGGAGERPRRAGEAASLGCSEDGGPCDREAGPDGGAAPTEEELERIRERNGFIRAADRALTDLRQRSYEGKLTTSRRWRKRSMQPEGTDARAFEERLLLYIEQHNHAEDAPALGRIAAPEPLEARLGGAEIPPDEPLPDPVVEDIALIYGKKAIYLYSKALMSHSFARALFQTMESDEVATFVDVVRSESRVYPRPVAADSFGNPPYLWAPSKTLEVYRKVASSGSFPDIEMTKTSLGAPYFYSTLYLSAAQGRALAEWYGVEKAMNP